MFEIRNSLSQREGTMSVHFAEDVLILVKMRTEDKSLRMQTPQCPGCIPLRSPFLLQMYETDALEAF
jgi:hypothetical protein